MHRNRIVRERQSSDTAVYLNLGCGSRYHPQWINIDIAVHAREVIQHDLSCGIPLPDSSCEVVYHSAVLEHLRPSDAAALMAECWRVLRPGGIVRAGVPDLERICEVYLSKLKGAQNGDEAAADDYDWIMLELIDQIQREKSGGEMLAYLQQDPLPNEAFVYERIGEEGRQLVKALRNCPLHQRRETSSGGSFVAFVHRLRTGPRRQPGAAKRRTLEWLLGVDDKRALEIGRFRLAGEVHQWMYDRYSLARLLGRAGFVDPRPQAAGTSQIPNWTSFHLDTLPDGQVIKPDLFFMEAIRPGGHVHD